MSLVDKPVNVLAGSPFLLDGLSYIAPRFDAVLCDIWGVLHDGVTVRTDAVEALYAFRRKRGPVLLLTNAPVPRSVVQKGLQALSVPDDAYDLILSAGDVVRDLLSERDGDRVHHLGPERDKILFSGLDLQLVEADDADLVLCSGLFDDLRETPDDYGGLLAEFRRRDVEMICANPDIVVEQGGRLFFCAGALARIYDDLGGTVIYAGKPDILIYRRALACLARLSGRDLQAASVLAIGDGLATDVQGARNAGLPVLFIQGGIHGVAHEDQGRLSEKLDDFASSLAGVMPHLSW